MSKKEAIELEELRRMAPIIDYLREHPGAVDTLRQYIQATDAEPPKMTHNIHSGIHVDMDKIKFIPIKPITSLKWPEGNPYA